ncbi:MAG: ATP-binding protein, partial [Phycisphaerae bacterium]
LNLLGNAAKYTQQGSITLRVRRRGDGMTFSVQDTGAGIPEDQRDVVFEAFGRADRADDGAEVEGHGRGLAIGRSLAERLGGSLVLEPGSADGCTFTLTVPSAWNEQGGEEHKERTDKHRYAGTGATS